MNGNLSADQAQWLAHMTMFGSDAYPIRKIGSKWSFERAFGVGGSPLMYPTKKAALAAVEAFRAHLGDLKACRVEAA